MRPTFLNGWQNPSREKRERIVRVGTHRAGTELLIAKVKFGETHAITELGDIFKHKQRMDLACTPGIELSKQNEGRYRIEDGTAEYVACAQCRFILRLDKEDNGD